MKKIVCQKCNIEKEEAFFLPTQNTFFNGYLSICTSCLEKMASSIDESEHWNFINKICRWADWAFVPDQWTALYKEHKMGAIKFYGRVYGNNTGDDLIDWNSQNERWLKLQNEGVLDNANQELTQAEKIRRLHDWAGVSDPEELAYLDTFFQGLKRTFPISDGIHEDQAKKLTKVSWAMEAFLRSNEPIPSELLKSYSEFTKMGGFTPENASDSNSIETFGEWAIWVEKKGYNLEFFEEDKDIVDITMSNIQKTITELILSNSEIASLAEDKKRKLESVKLLEEKREGFEEDFVEMEEEEEIEYEDELEEELE